MDIKNVLISLLRSKVLGGEIDKEKLTELSSEELNNLYTLGMCHDVAHILGAALSESGALDGKEHEKAMFTDAHVLAVFRYRRIVDELSAVSSLFEEEGISHIVLKGSVLRNHYPEPWMRTSCDIDILVKKEHLERAKTLAMERLGYTYKGKTEHDVMLKSPTGLPLELHFALVEKLFFKQSYKVLMSVWQRAALAEGKKYTYTVPDDFFYLYHIIHMAKHFISGGCGIRSFVDMWILEKFIPHDDEQRRALLAETGFAKFEEGMRKLAYAWFGGGEKDETTAALENVIFTGGAYGTLANGVNLDVAKKHGKIGYIFSRAFPSYEMMKSIYPILEKRKILLPFYYIKRLVRIALSKRSGRVQAELSKFKDIDKGAVEEATNLLKHLGLDKVK